MQINLHKTSHVLFFVFFLPILSIAIAWGFSKALPNPPFWLDTITPLLAYGILYGLFENYAWNWKVFCNLGITVFPDMRGRWSGFQSSSYKVDGNNVKIPARLEIVQTFSKIFVHAYYEKSQSEAVIASFTHINGGKYLFYTYDSEPNSLKSGTMANHKGTVKLKYLAGEKKLVGLYFNSMGNTGEMELDFEGLVLKDRF